MKELLKLQDDISARVVGIREHRADWPCSKGCDHCCRSLANVPQLTSAEWRLLAEGLAALPPAQMQAVAAKITTLPTQPSSPVVCPMLDEIGGHCLVYAHRPVACRSYGFYVQRDLGLYCADIKARVAAGSLADVVWGNHDAIDRELAKLGDARPLTEWFGEEEDEEEGIGKA